jgi:WD40 repeat protein
LRQLECAERTRTHGCFSPDGAWLLLFYGRDATVVGDCFLYDLVSAAPARPVVLPGVVRSIRWSPDSMRLIALARQDEEVVLVEARSMKQTGSVRSAGSPYSGAGFFADGRRFWAMTYENQAIVFDAADCRELWRVDYDAYWTDVVFSADGAFSLLTNSTEDRMAIGDLSLHAKVRLAPNPTFALCLDGEENGGELVTQVVV